MRPTPNDRNVLPRQKRMKPHTITKTQRVVIGLQAPTSSLADTDQCDPAEPHSNILGADEAIPTPNVAAGVGCQFPYDEAAAGIVEAGGSMNYPTVEPAYKIQSPNVEPAARLNSPHVEPPAQLQSPNVQVPPGPQSVIRVSDLPRPTSASALQLSTLDMEHQDYNHVSAHPVHSGVHRNTTEQDVGGHTQDMVSSLQAMFVSFSQSMADVNSRLDRMAASNPATLARTVADLGMQVGMLSDRLTDIQK